MTAKKSFLSKWLPGQAPDIPPLSGPLTVEVAEHWLSERVAHHARIPLAEVSPTQPFASYGLDSMTAVGISAEVETWLAREIPPTVVWDYPSIRELSEHLVAEAEIVR